MQIAFHSDVADFSVNLQNYQNISEILDEVQKQRKSIAQKLPTVLPIIIYHGEIPWNVDNSMKPMFEVIKGTEKFIPQQESIVIDLSIIPDEKIRGIAEVSAFILALKYSRSPLLFEKMPEIIHMFEGVGVQRLQYLEVVITYLAYATPECNKAEFSKIVKRELDLGDGNMKKSSNIWAELGYVAGLKDGFKKGEGTGFKKGIVHEKQLEEENEKKAIKRNQESTAMKMLKNGISIEEISDFTSVSIEEVRVLKKKIENEEL